MATVVIVVKVVVGWAALGRPGLLTPGVDRERRDTAKGRQWPELGISISMTALWPSHCL